MQAVPSLSSSDSLKCFLHAIVTALVIVFGVIAISGVIVVVFIVPSLPSCDSPSVQFAVHNNVIVVVTALVFIFGVIAISCTIVIVVVVPSLPSYPLTHRVCTLR